MAAANNASRDKWNSQAQLPKTNNQLEIPSSRSPGCAYSSRQKKPTVPVFTMPLHYPRYKKADYETMPEWKLDKLLEEYGLPSKGSLDEKREYAMGCFLFGDQQD